MSRELYQLSYGPPTTCQIIILYKVWITVNDRLEKIFNMWNNPLAQGMS